MADTPISGLSAAATLDATEIYPADQGGNSRGVTGALIQALMRAAGSATAGSWPILGSGTVLSSPVAGAEEFDGNVEYFSPAASSRGVVPAEYFVCLAAASPYTLGNNTNTQKAFNSTTNGTLTLPAGIFFFDALLSLSSMSAAAANNCLFDLKGGGGATLGNVLYYICGVDGATATPTLAQGSMSNASASVAPIVTGVANAALQLSIRGMFQVTVGGTIIPSIKLTSAAAAVVAGNSYFRCRCAGPSGATSSGNWS